MALNEGQIAGRIFAAVVVIGLVLVLMSAGGSAFQKTPADQIAISYGGGPFEGNQFQRVVQPGSTLTFNGFFDHWYEYPVTQRNYIVSRDANVGDFNRSDVVKVSTKDAIEADFEIAVYFKLNTSIIRQFHETIGLKYHAWTESGWDKMLLDNFRQPIENALTIESPKYTAREWFADPEAVIDTQNLIADALKDRITTVLGAPYFCGPSYQNGSKDCPDFKVVLKKPTLPAGVVSSFEDQVSSQNAVLTAQNKADATVKVAEGERRSQEALKGIYTDPNYIAYLRVLAMQECAKNPNCTLVVTPDGTGVNINTGK